jgi:tRNA modification GTPase
MVFPRAIKPKDVSWSMPTSEPTIAAIATPPGEGGVGVVRLSGFDALSIARQIFQPSRANATIHSHRVVHGQLRDSTSGSIIDEALLCFMRGPHSYTGEDVVELQCHGSPVVLQRVLSCCLAGGARLANRGEFTLRAFLNGRMDLAQAEAVVDLVRARTATAAQVAAQGVTGALANRLEPSIGAITGTLAYLEATIDFVEEGLPEAAATSLASTIAEVRRTIEELLQRASHGAVLRDGIRVVLVGKPNVGKSSLLNALLRRDRAIVTPVAGTTRDTLEEAADVHGLPMYLIDTAGLTETDDMVERIGVERSRAALAAADIVMLVVDAGASITIEDANAVAEIRAAASHAPVILVRNKWDLVDNGVMPEDESLFIGEWKPKTEIRCSALFGDGLTALEDSLANIALGGQALHAEDTLVENARQAESLRAAVEALAIAHDGLVGSRPPELVCIDLRTALESLSSVTGMNVGEAVLDRIFSDFCIGK